METSQPPSFRSSIEVYRHVRPKKATTPSLVDAVARLRRKNVVHHGFAHKDLHSVAQSYAPSRRESPKLKCSLKSGNRWLCARSRPVRAWCFEHGQRDSPKFKYSLKGVHQWLCALSGLAMAWSLASGQRRMWNEVLFSDSVICLVQLCLLALMALIGPHKQRTRTTRPPSAYLRELATLIDHGPALALPQRGDRTSNPATQALLL